MIPEGTSMIINEIRKKYANHDTTNFLVSDFLAAFGSPVDALMYLHLFWPKFISFEGMVFNEETLEDADDRLRVLEALSRYGGDKTRTEKSFNLFEFPSGFFGKNSSESSDEVDEFLAEKLVELWECKLALAFPEREFVVKTMSTEETGGERGVIFFVLRS